MTLKLYASRKEWPLRDVEVDATHERVRVGDLEDGPPDDDTQVGLIRLRIVARGELDEGQRERLLYIAGRCPVHRTLQGGAQDYDPTGCGAGLAAAAVLLLALHIV